MKYATAKKEEVLAAALEDPNYCLQLKKDGSSYIWAKDLDGTVHLYGDKISKKDGKVIDKIDNVQHMKEFAEKYFPCGSQLCIEITYGESSTDVNTIMLALPPKANQRQAENGLAGAYVFDILYWNDQEIYSMDFEDRWTEAMILFSGATTDSGFPERPVWLNYAPTYYEDKKKHLSEWLARGEEGGVLKMLRSTKKTSAAHHVRELGATPARPMNTTFKIKQVDTVDVVIMDVQLPTPVYTGKDPDTHPYKDAAGQPVNRLYALGMINAFVIGAYNGVGTLMQIGTVASGLDDLMRKDAANNPQDYIGNVIEVDCMSKDNEARSLRHPRLMRRRFDKTAEQCRMEDIFS
jgi:hypothetical protein